MTRRLLLALIGGNIVSPIPYGAECDVQEVDDAAVAGGSLSTVTSATAGFSSGDTGKTFTLADPSSGAVTQGTVTFVNSTTLTMSVAAGGAITDGRFIWGTDDTAAWQAALDAALPGQTVDIASTDWRSLITHLDVPQDVHLGCYGRGPFEPDSNPAGNSHGPTFVVVQDSDPAIVMGPWGSSVGDFIFYSANQVHHLYDTAITSYGACIGTIVYAGGCRVGSSYFANFNICIELNGGRHHVDRPQMGALQAGLVIDQSQDRITVEAINVAPYWAICEGRAYGPTAGTLDEWALSNAVAVYIRRSDSFHIHEIVTFGAYAGMVLEDSPDTGLSTRPGYGQVGQVDFDGVAYGVYASATGSPGVLIGSAILGANGSGVGTAGQAGIATVTGGTIAPKVVVKSWSHRGSWASGASSSGAGTLIVPGTNPG